jgi:hypothetical protein
MYITYHNSQSKVINYHLLGDFCLANFKFLTDFDGTRREIGYNFLWLKFQNCVRNRALEFFIRATVKSDGLSIRVDRFQDFPPRFLMVGSRNLHLPPNNMCAKYFYFKSIFIVWFWRFLILQKPDKIYRFVPKYFAHLILGGKWRFPGPTNKSLRINDPP